MQKVAFSIGPLHFYWYGLIVVAAVLAAFSITLWRARRLNQPLTPVFDLLFWSVPAGVVGARVYYVLANWELYRQNPLDAVRVWQGGLAVYGALLAFVIVLWLYTRQHRLPFGVWADMVAPALAGGQAVGQWANVINQEAFGYPTSLAWGVYIDFALRPAGYEQFDYFHPVAVYESLWNAALFPVLLLIAWLGRRLARPLPPGSLCLVYILLYSLGHFYFVGLRLDSEIVWGVRLGQIFSALFSAVAFVLLIRAGRRRSADKH